MNPERKCPRCGQPVSDQVVLGLCPNCLAKAFAESPPEDNGELTESTINKHPTGNAIIHPDLPVKHPNSEVRASSFYRVGSESPSSGQGEVQDPHHDWRVGDVILDEYQVLGILGQGAMGKVYLVAESMSTEYKFAVKRMRLTDDRLRRLFLAELQSWMDLPEHRHLTTCHFFRSVDFEQIIFAEYVECGSLSDWIRNRKLNRLDLILDVAIQFAWGLHTLHELGMIHQDVKPGNALVNMAGEVKITDFGLARSRAYGEFRPQGGSQETSQISFGGMTPGYCSPEQAQQLPLSYRTDIWSWGVSVLEMFTGRITWSSGPEVEKAFEQHLTSPQPNSHTPIPPAVADVLRQCFKANPRDRWDSMLGAALTLAQLYYRLTGRYYPRVMPTFPAREDHSVTARDRRTASVRGTEWLNPKDCLTAALYADGREPFTAEIIMHSRNNALSRKAQAIFDLSVYEEARLIYERLVSRGRKDMENDLAELCLLKASVHEFTDDFPGALTLCDRAITIREQIVNQDKRPEMSHDLALAYSIKGCTLSALSNYRAAIVLFERGLEIWEDLVSKQGIGALANHLASAYLNMADALLQLGQYRNSIVFCDQVMFTFKKHSHQEEAQHISKQVAEAYYGKANALMGLGDYASAEILYGRALHVIENMVAKDGRLEYLNTLAHIYINNAHAVLLLHNLDEAFAAIVRATEIWDHLVHRERRREFANDLAWGYWNKAKIVSMIGDHRSALMLADVAVRIWEVLVKQKGRQGLMGNLACAKAIRATEMIAIGEYYQGLQELRSVKDVLEYEINRTGRADLQNYLSWITTYIAPPTVPIVVNEMQHTIITGRAELHNCLSWITTYIAPPAVPVVANEKRKSIITGSADLHNYRSWITRQSLMSRLARFFKQSSS